MIKVKICGIQRPEDALVAAEAGADLVGLVFVPERHRRLDIHAAKHIVTVLRTSTDQVPRVVGLFADQSLDEVNEIIDDCGLDLAQLCGTESPEYCGQVKAQVIKVVHVDVSITGAGAIDGLADRVGSYRDAGHLVTLDRLIEGVPGAPGAASIGVSPPGCLSGAILSCWPEAWHRTTSPGPSTRSNPGVSTCPVAWKPTGPRTMTRFERLSTTPGSHQHSAISRQPQS